MRCSTDYPADTGCPLQIKPRVNAARTGVETAAVKHSLNPFDELAIEEAVRLRERKHASYPVEDILAVSVGPAKSADGLRTALAIGADRALLVKHDDGAADGVNGPEPLAVAKVLRAIAEQEKRNLVVMGKQSIDDDMGQTGPMLAALLGWGQATQVSKVGFEEDGSLVITKEVDGGTDTVRGKLPLVLTTDLRLNEPRFATLPNIMKAKKKELKTLTAQDLGVDMAKRLKTLRVEGELAGSISDVADADDL